MDAWDFKKWRKRMGYSQVQAGNKLGLSRGAVQYWESEIRPVPVAVELACQELSRRARQRPEFGPVTLLYADRPIAQAVSAPCGDLVLRCEPHPNNDSALDRVDRLRQTVGLFIPLIVDDNGAVIWSAPELWQECDARKRSVVGERSEVGA
jgi:DNA-binding XRE family transcriptional regulator